jgi:hypothetical protein
VTCFSGHIALGGKYGVFENWHRHWLAILPIAKTEQYDLFMTVHRKKSLSDSLHVRMQVACNAEKLTLDALENPGASHSLHKDHYKINAKALPYLSAH